MTPQSSILRVRAAGGGKENEGTSQGNAYFSRPLTGRVSISSSLVGK